MDKKIKRKTWTTKRMAMIAGACVIVALFLYSFVWMDSSSRLNVDRDRLMVHTVEEGAFQEFIDVSGTIQPIRTVFLDAIEGGMVQEVKRQSGEMVEEGDTILVLSNSNLQLQVMSQEANLYEQINNIRNSRMQLEQRHLTLREQLASAETQLSILKPQYERNKKLFENDLISVQEYEESRENYEFQRIRYELTYESYQKDSLQMANQLHQLDESEGRLWQRLPAIQQILDNLAITAPITGQLTTIEIDQGQSISPSERIGQVDLLDGFKVRVNIDEFYLARIVPGLQGSFTFAGERHELVISRVYPVIQDGQFQVDMDFTENEISGLRRGQTVRIRLELDTPASALLVERGGFYQSTGGNWIYLLVNGESRAIRQPIRLGRGNPNYFEVLEGLEPGDKVITSSYDTFGDNEVLVLQ